MVNDGSQSGGVPGFANWLFNSADGSHQVDVMINADAPPAAVEEAFTTLAVEQGSREAFSGQPCAAGEPVTPHALRRAAQDPTIPREGLR